MIEVMALVFVDEHSQLLLCFLVNDFAWFPSKFA